MRRLAILTLILTTLSVVGSLGFLRAAAEDTHPFATTWCESPVVVPLAGENVDGVITAAAGVSVARGAEARLGTRGPVLRFLGNGSRVQVELGQTLFHTQWLFGGITEGDAIRADAFLGGARQEIPASSARGALMPAVEGLEIGMLSEAASTETTTGEINIFTGTSEVLFTNEGDSPIELIAAIGCPALELEAEQLVAPTWNPELQQFVAEHSISFTNHLANSRVRSLRGADPSVVSQVIDNMNINVSVGAGGFSAIEILDVDGSARIDWRVSDTFDGIGDTTLLDTELRLADSDVQEFTLTVGYTPNFNDPAWEQGIGFPAVAISLSGIVDDIPVRESAQSPEEVASDGSVLSSNLSSPQPELSIDLEVVEERPLTSAGRVEISHLLTITNEGETAVDNMVIDYPLVDMFGPGTVVEAFHARGAQGCSTPASESFNGGRFSTVLFDLDGLGYGEQCTIAIETILVAGVQAGQDGTTYVGQVTASARSGLRTATNTAPMAASITQEVGVDVELIGSEVTNLEDGGYRVEGIARVENVGALDLVAGSISFDVSRPAPTSAGTESDQPAVESAAVFFAGFVGDEQCATSAAPGGARSSVFVSGGIALNAGASCEVEFSFVAYPGQSTQDWTLSARFAAPVTAVQPELSVIGEDTVNFPEAPAIGSSTEIESITNNGNGTYSVRSTVTVSNVGDVPLVAANVSDDAESVFGSQILAHERVGDSCSFVSARSPLASSVVSPEANSCSVTMLSLIQPGSDLAGDQFEFSATASSPSGAEVDTSVVGNVIAFSEAPQFSPELIVESVERLDTETVAIVLAGSLENTGDVDVRNVQLDIDLARSFAQSNQDVDFAIQFASVQWLNRNEEWNGLGQTELLIGTDTIAVDGRVDFRVLIHAVPGDQPGPYEFEVTANGESPAGADFDVQTSSDQTAIPMIVLTGVSLESENNNDGTYSITHNVIVENAGAERLPSIDVFTSFANSFGSILLGVADITTTCGAPVDAGAQCVVTQRATVRPGAAVGPYDVIVNVGARDNSFVSAFTLPDQVNPLAVPDAEAILFNEEPSIALEGIVGNPRNNGDGTYDVTYFAEVSNTGDVPLYRVGVNNFVGETYGNQVVSDQVSGDACSAVSFQSPLEPGLSCEQTRTVTIRPLANLGPWTGSLAVTAATPSAAILEDDLRFDPITFEENLSIEFESELDEGRNNGLGTYSPTWSGTVTNTSDVPLVGVSLSNVGDGYGIVLLNSTSLADSCAAISPIVPMLPGAQCRVEQSHFISPGADLGPYELTTQVSAASASSQTVTAQSTTNDITFVENPGLDLATSVLSVESTEEDTLRVVQNVTIANSGDVRIDNLEATLDLEELFGDVPFRLDGVVSNDFFIAEEFTARESLNILAEGQALPVGAEGSIILVLSIEPGNEVGPFTGDLRAEGTSPAKANVSSVISAQLDLPSVAVQVVAQSVVNNQDGSYTVTSSYEITNDGTTALEFLRLNEQLATVYEGTNVRLVDIEGNGIPAADVEEIISSNNLIEWGARLPSGETARLTSTVIVEPGNNLGPFNPAVNVEATSPTGTVVSAVGASNEIIEFDEQPALRVAQASNRPEWDGSRFEVTFTIDVINGGDVELRNVQVREDLLNVLGAESRVIISNISSDAFVVNSNFDGLGQYPSANGDSTDTRDLGDTRLLSGLDTLAAGATGRIELDVIITPETRGVFNPRVVASARTPAGADLGTGDEQIEASTLTRLSVQGELGVAKQVVGEPVLQSDGTIAVTYEILVENAGPFPLDNVAVHDQLTQAFGVGSVFETSPVRIEAGSPCSGFASTSYDGGTVDPVLATGFELDSGERCRIQYDAVVEPSIALPGPYRSSAFAIATDPFSGTVIDDSTDGTNIDPDGNQEPGDNDIATSVVVELPQPTLQVMVEPFSAGQLDGSGRYEVQYLIAVENSGSVNVEATRLAADLDAQWDVDFEVLSVESETLQVNEGFNGDRDTNLIERGSEIAAGQRSEVLLTVRAVQPRNGELKLSVELLGESATGVPIATVLSETAVADGPNGSLGISWFDTLSTEERRLLAIGTAVILLFLALFVRSVLRVVSRFTSSDAAPLIEQPVEPSPGWSIAQDVETDIEVLVDLRQNDVLVDLTEADVHHRARRRRGRSPKRSVDS